MTFKVQTPRNWLVTHTIVQKRMIKIDQLFNVKKINLILYIQGASHKSRHFVIFKEMNIKSSILKILLNFKNWQAK